MVYTSDTATVKFLLKEKGFLKGKGRSTKSKAKKQIDIKCATNISIGSSSTVNDVSNDDEFILNIPLHLLTSEKIINNENQTKTKPVYKIISNTKTKSKPKIENSLRKPIKSPIKKSPRAMETYKPKVSPIALQNPLKSDSKEVCESTDDDDEFSIRLSPEQIKSFYNNFDNNSEKLVEKPTDSKPISTNNIKTNWHLADSTASNDSDDDEEFTITIPTCAWNKTEKLFS